MEIFLTSKSLSPLFQVLNPKNLGIKESKLFIEIKQDPLNAQIKPLTLNLKG